MKKEKHTPAPWTACRTLFDGKTVSFRIACNKHGSSNPLAECTGGYDSDEMAANARLIASAPELLEALKEITESFYVHPKDSFLKDIRERARAAIAKAESN